MGGWAKRTQRRFLICRIAGFQAADRPNGHRRPAENQSAIREIKICNTMKAISDFDRELNRRLSGLRQEGLYRELRRGDSPQSPQIQVEGKTLLNFSSNDYLGLANDPVLKNAAIEAVERYGAGSGASRLICSGAPHQELDQTIASFKATEA